MVPVTLWLVIKAPLFMISHSYLVVECRVRYIETCNNSKTSLKGNYSKLKKNKLSQPFNMP